MSGPQPDRKCSKCHTMCGTCLTPLKKSMGMPESTFKLPRNIKRIITIIAGEQIKVGDRVLLHDPAGKKGQTKNHSSGQVHYIVMTRIGNVSYPIQAIANPRKRKVAHFNSLKLSGVAYPLNQQHSPNQTTSPALSTPVR